MQFVPGFLHWPSLIVSATYPGNEIRSEMLTRLTGIENRKINSDCESIIVCQRMKVFILSCTPSIRIPFFVQLRVYLCSLPLYTRCAGYQSRERLDLVANKETNRRVFEVYNPVKKRITSIQTRKISKGVGPAQARDIHSNNTVHEQRSREREVDLWLRTS